MNQHWQCLQLWDIALDRLCNWTDSHCAAEKMHRCWVHSYVGQTLFIMPTVWHNWPLQSIKLLSWQHHKRCAFWNWLLSAEGIRRSCGAWNLLPDCCLNYTWCSPCWASATYPASANILSVPMFGPGISVLLARFRPFKARNSRR